MAADKDNILDLGTSAVHYQSSGYPLLLSRIKALLIDFLLLLLTMALLSQLFALFSDLPGELRIGAFVAIFFLYDPTLTSFFGGTIGHKVVGIRVKREVNENLNISFFAAVARFVVKSLLGWVSLLTVTGNERKRAIHDLVSGSVVILKKN